MKHKGWLIAAISLTVYLTVGLYLLWPSEPHTASVANEEQEVVQTTAPTANGLYLAANKVRREQSLPQYNNEPTLIEIANERCADMVQNKYYSHVNPETGVAAHDYIIEGIRQKSDYDGTVVVAENLDSRTTGGAEEFIRDWLGSEAHRATLLDPQFTHSGFAVCKDTAGFYIAVHIMVNYR